MTDLPLSIQSACAGRGVSTVFGTANRPHCEGVDKNSYSEKQFLCISMDHGTPAIFAPTPPPKISHAARDSTLIACAAALIFLVVPFTYYRIYTRRRKMGDGLIDESDDDDA